MYSIESNILRVEETQIIFDYSMKKYIEIGNLLIVRVDLVEADLTKIQ